MAEIKVVGYSKPRNAELIKMLESLLEEARSGDMVSGAFAGAHPDGTIFTCWTVGDTAKSQLAGATLQLQHRFMQTEFDQC